MKAILPTIWNFLKTLRDKPTEFASWEMLIMRAAFAWLVLWSMTKQIPPQSQAIPNGLALLMDLTWLARPDVWAIAPWIAGVGLLAFVAGVASPVSLFAPTWIYVAMGTLVNSQGAIKHYNQLIALALLAFWLASTVWTVARLVRDRKFSIMDPTILQRRAVYWVMVSIAAGYVTSAVSKLLATEGMWIFMTPNLAVQLVKSHLTVFHDTITTIQTVEYPPLAGFLVEHTWVAPILFGPGLILELFFFLALAGRAWAAIFGLVGIAMHMIIALVMNLVFPEHEALMLIFFVNIPYWVVAAWVAIRTRRKRPSPTTGVGLK